MGGRSKVGRRFLRCLVVALCATVFLGWTHAAYAGTTWVVNTTQDAMPADGDCSGVAGDCSLRQALARSNSDGGDTVELPASAIPYTLTIGTQFDGGGALHINNSVTIVGDGDTSAGVVIAANYNTFDDRLMLLGSPLTNIEIDNLTFLGGTIDGEGGAIESSANLTLNDVAFDSNSAGSGGALAVSGGEVDGTGVTFSNNSADGSGGAVLIGEATLNLTNSTIVGNSGGGGGIYNDGGELSLTNVTLDGNDNSDLEVNDDTDTEISNTIIGSGGCSGDGANGIVSEGNNIYPTGSCNFEEAGSDIPNGNAGLEALADNGGPTETEALSSTSDAIGNGSDCPSLDQRNFGRSGTCDIGAYAAGPQFTGTSGTALTASFTESYGACPATATIDWGDGTVSDAGRTCFSPPDTVSVVSVTITGTHTYSGPAYYHLVAEDSSGHSLAGGALVAQGAAPPPPPPPARLPAPSVGGVTFTGVAATTVIVNGSANPNGSPTSYVVNYGTTTAYGQQAGALSIGSGTTTLALSRPLSGLLPGTTYHVQIVATNSGGSTASADATFTTPGVLPPPVKGLSFDALPFSGTVLINGQPLVAGEQIPFGSIIDATKGTVTLEAIGPTGDVQAAAFSGAVFQVTQTSTGAIQLALVGGDFSVCKAKRTSAAVGAKTKPKPKPKGKPKAALAKPNTTVVRSLWGNGHGSFTTKGRYAAATVRGTVWHTSDRCDGTNVTVAEGSVSVLNLVTNATVIVNAPNQYLAQP